MCDLPADGFEAWLVRVGAPATAQVQRKGNETPPPIFSPQKRPIDAASYRKAIGNRVRENAGVIRSMSANTGRDLACGFHTSREAACCCVAPPERPHVANGDVDIPQRHIWLVKFDRENASKRLAMTERIIAQTVPQAKKPILWDPLCLSLVRAVW